MPNVEPHRLSATTLVRLVEGGELTAEAVVGSCLDRIAEREPVVRAWSHLAAEAALAGARERDRTAKRPAEGRAVRHQGHFRHRRHADDLRLADLYRLPAELATPAPRHCRARPAASCSARRSRPNSPTAIPARPTNPHDPGFYAGRLVERLGGGGRRFHGAARDRHADRRLGDPAGGLLRRRRVQAELWPVSAGRHADQHRSARHGRHHGALGRRHRAVPRGDDGDPLRGAGDAGDARRASACAAARIGTTRSRKAGPCSKRAADRLAAAGAAIVETELPARMRRCATSARPSSAPSRALRNHMPELYRHEALLSPRAARRQRSRAAESSRLDGLPRGLPRRREGAAAAQEWAGGFDAILTLPAPGQAPRGLASTGSRSSTRCGPSSTCRV